MESSKKTSNSNSGKSTNQAPVPASMLFPKPKAKVKTTTNCLTPNLFRLQNETKQQLSVLMKIECYTSETSQNIVENSLIIHKHLGENFQETDELAITTLKDAVKLNGQFFAHTETNKIIEEQAKKIFDKDFLKTKNL